MPAEAVVQAGVRRPAVQRAGWRRLRRPTRAAPAARRSRAVRLGLGPGAAAPGAFGAAGRLSRRLRHGLRRRLRRRGGGSSRQGAGWLRDGRDGGPLGACRRRLARRAARAQPQAVAVLGRSRRVNIGVASGRSTGVCSSRRANQSSASDVDEHHDRQQRRKAPAGAGAQACAASHGLARPASRKTSRQVVTRRRQVQFAAAAGAGRAPPAPSLSCGAGVEQQVVQLGHAPAGCRADSRRPAIRRWPQSRPARPRRRAAPS